MKNKKELYIIGNGFDLFMGLETSYYMSFLFELYMEEYMKTIKSKKKNKLYKTSLKEILNSISFNCKIIEILYTNKENLFLKFLVKGINKNNIDEILWFNIEKSIKDYIDVSIDYLKFNKVSKKYKEFIEILKNHIEYCNKNNEYLVNKEYEKFLLSELEKFEYKFGNNFISNRNLFAANTENKKKEEEIKKNSKSLDYNNLIIYKKNFNNTIFNFFDLKNNDKDKYIISFNYTTYLKEKFPKEFTNKNYFNIHGTFEKPIFGLGFYGKCDEKYKLFLKENRYKVNHTININYLNHIPDNINKIIIFGHSLSEMDYYDFKNIFNKYKTIIFDIEIEFRYFEYGNKKTSELNNIKEKSRELLMNYLKNEFNINKIDDLKIKYKKINENGEYMDKKYKYNKDIDDNENKLK